MTDRRTSETLEMYEEPLLENSNYMINEEPKFNLAPIINQLNSFCAVLWPVILTMLFASIVATQAQDENSKQAMRQYLFYKDIDASAAPTSTKAFEALFNALVIVAFIAVITFFVVILYKVNCMGGLVGYLMISSSTLLGLVGSSVVEKIFCEVLGWRIDSVTLSFIMYNFAVAGTVSIFYQKGVPTFIERGYLICTSVIMCWQLCQLPEWSTWAILFALAFWDLFAVLTPCGPLRCLVNLIEKEGRPMPGLLYEAEIEQQHISTNATSNYQHQQEKELALQHSNSIKQHSPHTVYLTFKNVLLRTFEKQLDEFCFDVFSPHKERVKALAAEYETKQKQLWQLLYVKYNVTYVRGDRLYPPFAQIFDQSLPMPTVKEQPKKETIKLGLGDFIFYSVLVARASMHNFSIFMACFICVLLGLAITMYLLAYFHALPALPISILLGIFFFFWSLQIGTPYIDFIISCGMY